MMNDDKEIAFLRFIISHLNIFKFGFSLSTYQNKDSLPLDVMLNYTFSIPENLASEWKGLLQETELVRHQLKQRAIAIKPP